MTQQVNGGFYIGKIHRLSNRLMNKILSQHRIQAFNGEQGRILHALWTQDGQSQTELAQMTGLSLNTLTKMLERMTVLGLVESCPHAQDRRKKIICLTEHAKSLQDQYDRISQEMTEIFYRGFSPEQIQRFEADLERVLENLSQAGKERL